MRVLPPGHDFQESLRHYITETDAFGPIDATPINDEDIRLGVLSFLFTEHTKFWKNSGRPPIVVGRRGAGKTAYIKRLKSDDTFNIVCEAEQPKAFQGILKTIDQVARKDKLFLEQISEYWQIMFLNVIMSATLDKYSKRGTPDALRPVEKYLSKIGVKDKTTPDQIFETVLKTSKDKSKKLAIQTAAAVGSIFLEKFYRDSLFDDARSSLAGFLKGQRARALLLMDSMDDYKLDDPFVRKSIDGLLKTLGLFNEANKDMQIRFCLPAESYHTIFDMSSNPLKDFRNQLLLHWTGSELVSIAADRFSAYVQLYETNWREQFGHFDLYKKGDPKRFLDTIFPEEVINLNGRVEGWLPYVMRHTQLLPRHFLQYLNSIFKSNQMMGGEHFRILPKAINKGVRAAEGVMSQEVFRAFRYKYPHARAVCEVLLPELPKIFDHGELQIAHKRHVMRLVKAKGIKGLGSPELVRDMFIEIGLIGRVLKKENGYVRAVFEYTMPHQLNVSLDDQLAIHPLFSGSYSSTKSKNHQQDDIYPIGADLADDLDTWA